MTVVLTALAELLFPPLCLSCSSILLERKGHSFCSECYSRIRFITAPFCPVCGIPYPAEESPDHVCGDCILSRRHIGAARSLGVYESVLLEAIYAFKYGGNLTLGESLGRLMANHDYPAFRIGGYSLVIPVPLHPRRLRQRGFNQSVILARVVAKRHGIAMEFRTLRRIVDTESQAGLKKEERRSNIRNAFAITEPERVRGKHILLIDDVYTTGSTLGECARTLLKGGAEAVGALTLARAIQEPR